MSRPVIIRNGASDVKNVKDKNEKLLMFGNQYHAYFGSLDSVYFNISSDDYGGVVTVKNLPIGVIGVPSSVTGDNSIRVISLFNMDYNHPENGSTDMVTMSNPDKSFLDYKNLFTGPYRDNNKSGLTSYNPPFVDGWHDYNILILLSDNKNPGNWRTSSTIPNPGGQQRGFSPAALCIWRYDPLSSLSTQGYWYMPSMHELIEEGVHRTQIDAGFLEVKNLYNVGLGRIPYDTSSYNNSKSYYASRFIGSQAGIGGNSSKYDVYFKYNRSQYYATSQDSGMVQAWCKLIKENGKWILDPSYHID